MPIRTLHTYVLSQLERSSHPLSSQRLKGSITYWSAHFMKCIFALTFSIRSKWLTFFKDLFWELSTDHLNKTRFYEIAPSFSNRTWYQILLFRGVFCLKQGTFSNHMVHLRLLDLWTCVEYFWEKRNCLSATVTGYKSFILRYCPSNL